MKLKTFILTFLMMSCSIVFGQGTETASATTEAQLWLHLNDDEIGTISLANDIKITATCPIPNGKKVTIDLNGHKLFTEEEIYIINNEGKLTITDNSEGKTGTISSTLGIYNGVTPTRTSVTDVKYDRVLTINGGVFNSSSTNGNAATIYNYRGVIKINGGEFYGEHSAITNYGMATIANAYIECLNRDNGAAAIINDFEIAYGENVNIVGRYTTVTETAYTTGTEPTYLFAELNGTKYPSLQAALDACTTDDINTINLLFHNSDNATVSQEEGINIIIDGNSYKGRQFEYTGTIYINGNSRHTGTETLTIQDVNFVTTDNEHDFISCNDGGDPVIRYAHNVTVQNCNFNATEESTAVVALRFRQSYNINVVGGTFTNLHSVMWATGTSNATVDGITATNCKEGGISFGTSTPVYVKNSTIAGAQYGVRADGSGAYSLNVEKSTLSAEVPVIVRNTTGEYNLTVKEDATLASTNNGPQVVVTAGKDNEAYVTPTSKVNVTLYDNVTSTFGLTAKIGNAFYATLQDAVDNAKTGETVTLIADNCKEDVTVTQAPNYAITIDGAEKTFKGTITVDGKSARYETTALTIKNVNFDATEGITYDACVRLGGVDAQRYTNNVTVESCTFTDNDYSSVAVKSYTGGDWNLVVKDCEANGMHSLAQLANVEKGLVIRGNTATTKNGINLNQTAVGTIEGNIINVKGYAVRAGVNNSNGGNITLNENTLKTDNTEGDPVIELRGTVVALNMEKNVVSGNTHIKGTAGTISVDENYWDGKEAPVVPEGSAPIVVNSYYSDEALTNLVRNEMGSIYAFVSNDRIFGDVTTNAKESIKIEIIGKDGNLIGTSSLENLSYATGFNKQLTWRINLGDDDSDSWAMAWEEGCPSINNMPAKVKLYVDDAAVAEAEIRYTADGDGKSPVFAAKTNAEGKINSFIACTGEYNLNKANTFLKEALTAGDNVAITVAGTYAVPTGKDLTITGAVDGVVFDNIGATNMGGASVTFNNVTFDYYPNVNYTGFQHSGNLVYNNCTFEGQPFLYGTSETFNNCTFNQNSSDAYNVWTYGAKEVAFNECTFNSAGKSVLVYNEGACATDLTVTDTKFFASATVDDKAAIEIDCSLMPKGTSIVIDGVEEGKTTATGFGANTKSGSSLWNDKKVVEGAPNGGTSSEVIIDDVVVKEPALMNLAGGGTEENPYLISNLEDLIWFRYQVNAGVNNYACKYVKLADNIDLSSIENWTPIGDITYNSKYKPADDTKVFSGVFDGNNKVISNLKIEKIISDDENGPDADANVGLFGITGEGAVIKDLTLTNVNIETDGRNVGALAGFAYKATLSNITVNGNIQIKGGNNVSGVAGMTRHYDMSATNIKVIGNDGSTIVGNNIVGGIFAEIAPNGSAQTFESLSVENVAITGASGVGGIVGLLTTGAVNKVIVKDVVLTGRTDYQGDAMGRIRLGSVSGLMGGKYATIANVTTENVTAKNLDGDAVVLPIIGANYDASSNATEAKIGDTYYATLQTAINNVKNGETVTLLADCAEAVTFTQTKDVSFVLDGNDKTYTGSINITARAGKDAPSTLVIKNFNFETDKTSHDFIKSVETNYYPNNITITGCSFEGTSDINTEGYAVVAVRMKSANNLVIKDCTGTGLHSFLQNTAGWNLTIDNVYVDGAAEGGLALGTVQGVTVKNCEINSGRYGIRLDGQLNNNAVIESNKINAFIPVVVRKASVDGTITFKGTNEFTQSNTDGYWCVIGTSEYKENGELPTAATAKVSVTLTDETLDPAGIYGNFGVASINRDDKVMKYLSLAEALDAALDGETVNLHWTTGDAAISMEGTVCGKTVTITGTANVDWSKGWFYVGRNGAADGKVIFDNANLTSVSNSSAHGINVSGRKKGSTDTYNGTVEFKNSTVVLDYLIQKNVMTLDNSTLTVKNGCSLTGRLANETENGELATSTTTLNNGSKLVVNGQNGMNLGYEGYGVLNIDATSTFEATQNYGVAANGTMNIAGKASVAGTMTNSGAINLTDLNAKFTAKEGLTIVDKVNNKDYKIVYQDGTYQFVAKQFVAQIYDVDNNTNDDRRYESLQEAIEAVAEGETVKLMADVTITEAAYGENALNHARAINFTLDLNDKTLSANTGNSVFRFNIFGSGATDDVTVTIKNGTVVSGEDTWCTLMSSGISADVRAVMNLEDLVIENNKGNDFAVKAWANGVVNAEGVTINSTYGGGFYALGGEITLDDCTVNQEGLWEAPYNSMAVAVSNGGKMTVNSGTYSAAPLAATDGNNQGTSHGSWTGGVMSSGGTLIINGGTFSNGNIGGTATYPRELFIVGADADYGDNVNGQVIINGGTFTSIGDFIHCETIWGSANDSANDYMPTMGVTITAGDFTAIAGKTIGGCDPVSTGNPVDVEISGGTYGANHAIHNSYLVVGYIVVDNENGTYSVVEDQVAKIGDVTYKLLHEAFNAAQDGDEIVVLKEIVLTAGVTVAADKVVVLDLNGKTISMQDASNNSAYAIKNNGNLTIKDSAEGGKITFNSTTPDNSFGYATSTIGNGGHLTIENGLIENTTVGGASYAVDGIWHTGEASLTINDGTITATKIAVRQVPFSATAKNTVTINGGTLTGATAGLQMFNINNDAKLSETIIKGGTFNGTYAFYTSFTSAQASELATINIDGGTFNGYVFLYNGKDGSNAYPMTVAITDGLFNSGAYIYTKDANGNEVPIKAISGGTFSVDPSEYCAEEFTAIYDEVTELYNVMRTSAKLERTLANAGWYWFSSYVNIDGITGLDKLKNALGESGEQIKNATQFINYHPSSGWKGTLTSAKTKEMYQIKTTADNVTIYLEGSYSENLTIELKKGWNYLAYPMYDECSLNDALRGFTPQEGDIIKSKNSGNATYTNINGTLKWKGNLATLKPGEGYMYYSNSETVVSLTFSTSKSRTTIDEPKSVDYYWSCNDYEFASNMTVIAMLNIDDELVNDNYEIAAFANGECRGSARPVYVEEIDQYILFMTIHGEDVQELTFKYYDVNYGTVYELNNRINYSSDAVVGSIAEPYMLTRGTTGIGEAEMSQVNIYPNPTTTGTEINLQATCDTVEVFNALGAKVAEYQNVDSIDALETAGIYVIRITNNSNVQNCKLVVR